MKKHGKFGEVIVFPHFKGAVVIAIVVTDLIYYFMLRPMVFSMAGGEAKVFTLSMILVHYIASVLCVLDWLLFDKKGNFKLFDPII